MSLRGKGAEIAFGVSGLLLVGGIGADTAAEHVDVNSAAVATLESEAGDIQAQLDQGFPALEALSRDGDVTIREAKEYGATDEWYSLHNELADVQTDLDKEKDGSDFMNWAAKIGWKLGMVATAGSWMVLRVKTDRQSVDYHRKEFDIKLATQRLHDQLLKNYNMEGKVFGFNYVDNLPQFAASPIALAAFAEPEPAHGLAVFAKNEVEKGAATTVYETLKGVKAGDEFDCLTVKMLEPLFGAKIEIDEGGYDASDLAFKLSKVVDNFTRILAQPDIAIYSGDEARLNRRLRRSSITYVQSAARLLDQILPLDQDDEQNPACYRYSGDPEAVDDFSREVDGRHWIDFLEAEARSLAAESYPAEV